MRYFYSIFFLLCFLISACGDDLNRREGWENVPLPGDGTVSDDDAIGDEQPDPDPDPEPEDPEEPPVEEPTGAELYQTHCAVCHGALASSSKRGRSASEIQSALTSIRVMQNIELSAEEVQKVADALK